jgi:hypothetical protein
VQAVERQDAVRRREVFIGRNGLFEQRAGGRQRAAIDAVLQLDRGQVVRKRR